MAFVLPAIEVDRQALSIRSAGVHRSASGDQFLVLGKAPEQAGFGELVGPRQTWAYFHHHWGCGEALPPSLSVFPHL